MKKYIVKISLLLTLTVMAISCDSFMEEEPKSFLSPDFYYKTEAQVKAGVNGLYTFVDDIFDGDIESGTQTYVFLEYLPGYGIRPRAATSISMSQAMNLSVVEDNTTVEKLWKTAYFAIENSNGVIAGIESAETGGMNQAKIKNYLGEAYFMRAYNYFNLVRLFGEVPLKTTVSVDLSASQMPLSSIADVYTQIEKDLLKANELMAASPWVNTEGRVSKGAVKATLAKVYLTMAGFPLQKGVEYYKKAYDEAELVYLSTAFSLFNSYADLRDPLNDNKGEYIWMIQREEQYAGSPVHNNMLPYPEPAKPISTNSSFGGAIAPTQAFYNSYTDGDLRTAEKAFYYTQHEALDNSEVIQLGRPYIYKYWDNSSAKTGKSGQNYPLIRYADVLLMMAEAKAQADGGTTSNANAIDAYHKVRNRANPDESKPVQITTNEVLKERFWELCFETQTWYDMLRTNKAFNPITKQIVNLVGYQAIGHTEGRPFKESDLLFPYPLREKRLNPNLVRK